MSPRKRKRSGSVAKIESERRFDRSWSLGPSPTAATTGSRAAPQDDGGRNDDQSLGECLKSVVFPFASVTFTATAALLLEPARTSRTPDPSRYFPVGQRNR